MPEEQGIIDGVIEKVYSENYSMRKRLNGETEEAHDYEVPSYMLTESANIILEQNLSVEEQVRAYSPTLQDIYQGLLDEGSSLAVHLAAAMEIFVNGSLLGVILAALAYPVYSKVLKREREKIAPEILRLTDELMK